MKRKRLKKHGFTLIELLAVIVILAVIALIATPLVLNIIERAEKGAFRDGVYGIMEAAEFQVILDDLKYPITFVYPADSDKIKFKGTKPTEGYIQVVNEGKMKLALGNGRWCAVKDVNESQITITNGHCKKIDLNRPIISGYGDLSQEIDLNASYTLPNVTAVDKDGNPLSVTTTIKQGDKVVDSIDTSKAGSYTITYTTEPDKAGNTSTVTVTINVIKQETDTDKVIENGTKDGGLELIDDTYYYRVSSPKNYIQFNNELWRIISIEDGKMKLIRNEAITQIAWDVGNTHQWDRPATIRTYLNTTFYDQLSDVAKSQVVESRFSTGIVTLDTNASAAMVKADEEKTTWIGHVGIMNASDYAYSAISKFEDNNSCVNKALKNINCKNNWLFSAHLWTMNGDSSEPTSVLWIDPNGAIVNNIATNNTGNYAANRLSVKPVLYLKHDIKIISGDGSQENPFVIQ